MDLFDLAATEQAEKSIDVFILACSRSQEEANRTEEGWKESTRRFNRNRHREYARAWYEHHDRQLRCHEATFGALLAHHQSERDRYAQILSLEVTGGPSGEAA